MYNIFFFGFLGPHLWHMEGVRIGAELELQLTAYTTAIAMQDPSLICDLHHSSQQCRIPKPMREIRDQTRILMDTCWFRFLCATMRTPVMYNLDDKTIWVIRGTLGKGSFDIVQLLILKHKLYSIELIQSSTQ